MKEIVQIGDKVLRAVSEEVLKEEFSSSKLKKIVEEMKEALSSQKDGVAIAAPQIGYSKRIFVISEKVFPNQGDLENKNEIVYINPKIIRLSKEKKMMEEGCLSVRWKYGRIERSVRATIEAYDIEGKKFKRGASGLLAQIFQHETDHLNGVLFVDNAIELKEYKPEDFKNEN
jgi:peptide deformylase